MDEFFGLRAEMEAAIRQDDAARDRFDRFERKWAEREALLAAGDIEKWKLPERQPPAPQKQATMDAATEAHWNAWFDASFKNAVDRLIVPSVGDALGEIREELRKEFDQKLGELRGELTILQSIVRGEVRELKGRDAA
jgi:hypothetical protein